jgi:hypothetical protein
VAVGRALRFAIEGGLAVAYGRHILDLAKNPVLQQVIIGLVVISIAGSVWSIWKWVRRAKQQPRDALETQAG